MSAIVVAATKMTFGLCVNKVRSSLSGNLKDGDVNSQKLRALIVNDMEDVKTRINGYARRGLLSSASFIEEGLFLLNDIMDEPNKFQRLPLVMELAAWGDVFNDPFDDLFGYAVRFKSWLTKSDIKEVEKPKANSGYFDFDMNSTRELVEAMSELKMNSPDHFKSAMKCFNNAYTRATDEFFTESLSLQDRIMAAKLRIQSRLLASLEDQDLASVCKGFYLKDLHELPAIKEIFRYDLEGGIFSKFRKAERQQVVQSVSMINFVLFRFLNCFGNELVNVYDWPLIKDEDWVYNPLIPDETIFMELQRAEVEVPTLMCLRPLQSEISGWDPKLVAVNKDGDLILFRQRTNPEACELMKISGGLVSVFYTFPEFTLVSFLAIACDDVVYVFADNIQSNVPPGYMMYDVFVFDPRGSLLKVYKRFLLLDGSIVLAPTPAKMEVALCIPDEMMSREYPPKKEIGTKNNILAKEKIQGEVNYRSEEKIQGEEPEDNRSEEKIQGEVENSSKENIQGEVDYPSEEKIQGEVNNYSEETKENFLGNILLEIKMWKSTLATITDSYEVVAIEQSGYKVRVFDRNGRFAREFELRGGKYEAGVGITFNNLTKELVVVSRIESGYFLSTYEPETGQRRHYVRLSHIGEDCEEIHITSHYSGSMALVTKEHLLYIQ